jgi:hypothetical protein
LRHYRRKAKDESTIKTLEAEIRYNEKRLEIAGFYVERYEESRRSKSDKRFIESAPLDVKLHGVEHDANPDGHSFRKH